jgi:putative phosphoribosyl transferase
MLRPGRERAQRRIMVPTDRGRNVFRDRRDAGDRLAEVLADAVTAPAVALGIPRGGVVVAARVADRLGWPLGIVVTKKLGAPGNPELGVGAVASGVRVLELDVIVALGIGQRWIDRESARVEEEVRRRRETFPRAVSVDERTAVVIDDGVATGSTARAAGVWARRAGASRTVLAVPVAPRGVERRVGDAFDDVIAVDTPPGFRAVGQYYDDFEQVTDDEVRAILEAGRA